MTPEYIASSPEERSACDEIAVRGIELAFEANRAFDVRNNLKNGACHLGFLIKSTHLLIGRDSIGEQSPYVSSPSQIDLFTSSDH